MAIIIIGSGAKFGADQTAGFGGENTQGTTSTKSSQESQALNAEGAIIAVALTQIQEEISVDALLTDGTTPPSIGDTLGGGFVSGVTVTTSNTDFQKISVTIKKYADINAGG